MISHNCTPKVANLSMHCPLKENCQIKKGAWFSFSHFSDWKKYLPKRLNLTGKLEFNFQKSEQPSQLQWLPPSSCSFWMSPNTWLTRVILCGLMVTTLIFATSLTAFWELVEHVNNVDSIDWESDEGSFVGGADNKEVRMDGSFPGGIWKMTHLNFPPKTT